MISIAQKIISYIFPLNIEKRRGDLTNQLEITIENGRHVLNTKHVNYSFGGLHKVFEKIFEKEKIETLEIKNVLILGFGAGDVVEMLLEKYKFNCSITGIEKDHVVIELAMKYFNIKRFQNLKLLNEDAFTYVQSSQESFDMIIIDLFVDDKVPKKFDQDDFLNNINKLKASKGIVFFNRPFYDEATQKQSLEVAKKMNQIIGNTSLNKIKSYGIENCVLVHRH